MLTEIRQSAFVLKAKIRTEPLFVSLITFREAHGCDFLMAQNCSIGHPNGKWILPLSLIDRQVYRKPRYSESFAFFSSMSSHSCFQRLIFLQG